MPTGLLANVVLYVILGAMIAAAYVLIGGAIPNTILRAVAATVVATVFAVLAVAGFYLVRPR